MKATRLFLDTAFVQALLNRQDRYHPRAREILPALHTAKEVWVTEAVLVEIGNALSSFHRQAAVQFLRRCYETTNTIVVSVDSELLEKALTLYEARSDKTWGLTDCISFVVMGENDLSIALTADRHFIQAGFRAHMLETDEG